MPRSSASSAHPPAARAHFVVDGSNIATEGRSVPSLQQLNEAVLAFMEEHPDALITVVVDATFGHRIDAKEVKEFDAAVANNELVTPPAGAVGRGDAFVLSIAHKAKAGILSNDSFQEFHGQYDWLFDVGRLIGGKPVPHVGWVFVERSPVRGPKSRQSVKEAKLVADGIAPPRRRRRGVSSGSPLANEPLPVPTAPPPGPARSAAAAAAAPVTEEVAEQAVAAAATAPASGRSAPVNELMPFLEFVERHPMGTSCTAVIESYSSHGAYGRAGTVLVYIPLRLMDDPPPRSARSRMKIGEAVTLVVVGYAPERRSVDCALPHMAPASAAAPPADTDKPKRGRRTKPAADAVVAPDTPVADEPTAAESTTAGRRSRRKPTAAPDTAPDTAPVAVPDVPAAEPAKRRRGKVADVSAAPVTPEPAPKPAKRASKKAAAPAEPASAVASAKPAKKAAKAAKTPAKKTATKAPAKRAAKKAADPGTA